jgi:hypothetical protein
MALAPPRMMIVAIAMIVSLTPALPGGEGDAVSLRDVHVNRPFNWTRRERTSVGLLGLCE